MRHKLTLGFSPCPNDTFIFDALVNGRLDNNGFELEVVLADVEELNRMALAEKLDVSKISYGVFPQINDRYQLLNAGSALGSHCGPLLIAREPLSAGQLAHAIIAIPGVHTTANFLMSFAYPSIQKKQEYLFSEIEKAVLSGKVDAGVIIHENRFTYQERGLVKIRDLGEYWEQTTGYPIPLGGIAIHRRLKPSVRKTFDALLRQSVQYAFDNPDASKGYVKCHAQEMDETVMCSHIDLYVNDHSLDLGEKGKAAIQKMFEVGETLGMPRVEHSLFV